MQTITTTDKLKILQTYGRMTCGIDEINGKFNITIDNNTSFTVSEYTKDEAINSLFKDVDNMMWFEIE